MHSSHHLALMRELLVATSTLHGLPQAIGARVHANFLTKKVTSLSRLVRRSTFLNVYGSFCFGGRYLPISIQYFLSCVRSQCRQAQTDANLCVEYPI